jgi:hypothetical protein
MDAPNFIHEYHLKDLSFFCCMVSTEEFCLLSNSSNFPSLMDIYSCGSSTRY